MSVAKEAFVFGPPGCGNRLIRRLFSARNIDCTIAHPGLSHDEPPTPNPDVETFVFLTYRRVDFWCKSRGGTELEYETFTDLAAQWCVEIDMPWMDVHYEDIVAGPIEEGKRICTHAGELWFGDTVRHFWNVGAIYDGNAKYEGQRDARDPKCSEGPPRDVVLREPLVNR